MPRLVVVMWNSMLGYKGGSVRKLRCLGLARARGGEGNGTPLQCSCLENPRDGGAWWAAVYGVAQSRTRLKSLSSGRTRGQDITLAVSHFSVSEQQTKVESGLNLQKGRLLS